MPCCMRLGAPPRRFLASVFSRLPLVVLLLAILQIIASGGMLHLRGPSSGVGGPWRNPPCLPMARQQPPPCFQSLLCSGNPRGLPQQQQQQQQQQQHSLLLPHRRSFTLFRRKSSSSSSKKYPPPLSASALGGPSGGPPLVSSLLLSRLSRLTRPLARKLLPQLSFDNPLMLPAGVGMTALMQFVEQQKLLYRDHIILTQVGDFFEAYGADSLMLVEFCGLNPMAGKPKAGCPKGSVQTILDCLTNEGFAVNIYEEIPVPAGSVGPGSFLLRSLKTRALTQIVSPASPLYLPSHASLFQGEIGAHTNASLPIFSLFFSPSLGFCCGEVYVQERRMRVEGGLTAEGVRTRIDAALAAAGASLVSDANGNDTSSSPCRGELYVHLMGHGKAKQKALEMARCLLPGLQKKVVRGMSSAGAFHRAVLRQVASSLSLSPQEFSLSSRAQLARGGPGGAPKGPQPLPTATASQLGLLTSVAHHSHSLACASASLVPPLHQTVLPSDAPAGAARFLQRLLLLPPPHHIADAMQETLRQLLLLNVSSDSMQQETQGKQHHSTGDRETPQGYVSSQQQEQLLLPSAKVPHVGKVVQLISSRKANRTLFADLLRLLHPTAYCLSHHPPQLLQPLFLLLQHETQQTVSPQTMSQGVQQAIHKIQEVIYEDSETHEQAVDAMAVAAAAAAEAARQAEAGMLSGPSGEAAATAAATAAAAAAAHCERAAAAAGHEAESSTCGVIAALDEFFQRSELFRCHVQPHLFVESLLKVSLAADALVVQLLNDFVSVVLRPLTFGSKDGRQKGLVEALEEVLQQLEAGEASSKGDSKETAEEGLRLVLLLRQERQQQLKQLQQQRPKLLAFLQRYLTADLLNETIYLKKEKPPLSPPPQTNGKNQKAAAETPEKETVEKAPREDDNTPEAPRDRNHRVLSGCWSTPRVMAAVRRYGAACAAATSEVKAAIEKLSADLQPLLPTIIQAAHLISILQAAGHHASFASSHGWSLPELRNDGSMELQVREMTPYYLPRGWPQVGSNKNSNNNNSSAEGQQEEDGAAAAAGSSSQVYRHPSAECRTASSASFDMNGLFLLTGENMAGKSTFCRSTLALALLANAGLFCPCAPGTRVPRYLNFLSSSYVSHDSPLERKSFFLHEAQQLKAALDRTVETAAPQHHRQQQQLMDAAEMQSRPEEAGNTTTTTAAPAAAPAATAPAAPAAATEVAARSFLILDEPCKGTAPNCGAALLGSLIEALAGVKAQGIISTHLHQQLDALPLKLPPRALAFKQMKIKRSSSSSSSSTSNSSSSSSSPHGQPPAHRKEHLQQQEWQTAEDGLWGDSSSSSSSSGELGEEADWQFELADGICRDSNALHAAERAGFSPSVLRRAKALLQHLDAQQQQRQGQLLLRPDEEKSQLPAAKAEPAAAAAAAAAGASSEEGPLILMDGLADAVQARAASALLLQRKLSSLRHLMKQVAADLLLRAGADDTRSSSSISSKSSNEVLLLLPPPQQLEPPPSWVGSACVYMLVALERTYSKGVLAGKEEEIQRREERLCMRPALGSFRVYVGESENLRERLKRHRQKPQWASCTALVLRAEEKGHARNVEMNLIRELLNDPEVILTSLKDGNRKAGDTAQRRRVETCQEEILELMNCPDNPALPCSSKL